MGHIFKTGLEGEGDNSAVPVRMLTAIPNQLKAQRTCVPGLILLVTTSLLLTACARPKGDLGRAKPNVLHDRVAKDLGMLYRYAQKQDVSNLNLTDQETELRGRGWTLVIPPASEDWVGANKAQLQRQGFLKDPYAAMNPSSYYVYLRSDKYRSSETRYTRLIDDMSADRKLLPPFCKIARMVLVSDHERLDALKRQTDVNPQFATGVRARTKENKTSWIGCCGQPEGVCRPTKWPSTLLRLKRHHLSRSGMPTMAMNCCDVNTKSCRQNAMPRSSHV